MLGSVANVNSLRLETLWRGGHVSSLSSESGLCVKQCAHSASESARSRKPGSYSSAVSCILMSSACSYRVDNLILLIQACAG